MKKIFNSKKKIILISTIAIIVILTGCLVLPHAFASKDEGGELIEVGSFIEGTNIKGTAEDDNASAEQNAEKKTDAEAEQIITNEPAKTITQTVSGKKVTLKYQSTKDGKDFFYDTNDRYIYLSDNNEEITIDSKTKEIISIKFKDLSKDSSKAVKTTQKEAEQIAKEFAKQYCDLSKYDKLEVQERSSGYMLSYIKTISGFDSSRYVNITIKGSNVTSFYMTPDMFEGIDVSKISITEEELIKKIKQNHAQKHGDEFFNFSLDSVMIVVKDGKLQARVYYQELDEKGNIISVGGLVQIYIDLS